MSGPGEPYPSREATFDAFAGRVSAGKARTFREFGIDVVMGERGGAWFEDAFGGRRFLDCHCNGGVFNLGHRHPAVVAAVREALGRLDVGNHHLVSGWRARLAERLCASTGGALAGAVFGVGGGEAVDLALKLARGVTGRRRVVSARGGYHGHTGLALAAGDPKDREPFGASSRRRSGATRRR
jgi:4-aminobutyrate aminotransferase-like enzyme